MINITDLDKSNYRLMDANERRLYLKYAHAFSFRQVDKLAWEVDYYREKSTRKYKSPKYTYPNF